MPNQNLLDSLDSLRDYYTRQQKAAATLQSTLKAAADMQSRTQKILSDYSQFAAAADVTSAQALFERLHLKEETVDPLAPELRREIKALSVLTTALKQAAAALRAQPIDVVGLDKALTHLQSADYDDVLSLGAELGAELKAASATLSDEFGMKLRDALADIGVAIGGRPPTFQIGRYELDTNFAKRNLVIRYGKDIVTPKVKLTVEETIKAYQSAEKRVSGRAVDGRKWIARFNEAYHNARRRQGGVELRVNIVECYREMWLLSQGRTFNVEPSKNTASDYSRAQFLYDLVEFTYVQRLDHDGYFSRAHVATRSQDNPTRNMWVVEGDGPYDGRSIADIEFVKD